MCLSLIIQPTDPPICRDCKLQSFLSLREQRKRSMALHEEDSMLTKLELACWDLKTLLQTSTNMEDSLVKMDKRFEDINESLSTASKRVAPLHSLAMAAKALETRINRAVSPALALLDSFKLSESLQHKLLEISSKLSTKEKPQKRLKTLLRYVDSVDRLNAAINSITQDGEPVILKLQEVVEFLSRTRATDQYRAHRLRETLVTLKALYETEVDAMKFDGLLDEALLSLQDEYEGILQQLKHQNIGESHEDDEAEMIASDLGTELEIQILGRISETLAANDCLDICIDIFVKVLCGYKLYFYSIKINHKMFKEAIYKHGLLDYERAI